MDKGILQFKPVLGQEKPLERLGAAFEALAASYVNEHKGEASKARLAQDLLRLGFEKCIACRADGKVINIAAIEYCYDDGCPLHGLFPQFAAGVMTVTGDKGSDENHH